MRVRARPRGRRRRRAGRARREPRRAGRPRCHALRARVRRVRPLPEPPHEPLRGHPRHARRRPLPDGTTRFALNGGPLSHFMGTSTFAEYTVVPEIALAKVSPDAPLDACAPFACGLSTGHRRRAVHRPGRSRARPASSSAAASSGWARSSAAGWRAPSGSSRSTSRRSGSPKRAVTARPTRASPPTTRSTGSARRPAASAPTTPSRRPATSRVMQQAVEAAREAWGLATMIGVAGKGETLDVVPRLLITGRRVTGSSFGGVKGRTQVPRARRPLARRRVRRRGPRHAPASRSTR